ncbi:glycosyl hydrolase family 65 protein [Nocardia arizonensis]|uniref:glycosyl hydrolase family 65 protein n=1 Tax=Nocardia arizonensis TaxID=1141647 RepID=UPI0009EE852A
MDLALPEAEFTLSYRGQPLTVEVSHTRVLVRLHPSAAAPIRIHIEDAETLISGQSRESRHGGGSMPSRHRRGS